MTDKSQASSIIGELISREKYRFANADLIAEVVKDTLDLYVDGTHVPPRGPLEAWSHGDGTATDTNFEDLLVRYRDRPLDLRGPTDGVGKIGGTR